MGLLGYNNTNNANRQSGCGRPGCGCLIFIIFLLLVAGYFFRGNIGINLPQINLPGGTIFQQNQEEQKDDDTFDYNRDKDYGKTLRKGLDDDDVNGI